MHPQFARHLLQKTTELSTTLHDQRLLGPAFGTEDESKAKDRCTTYYQGNLKILGMISWKKFIYFLTFDNIAATKLAQKNGGQGPIQWRAKVLLLCPT